MKQKMVIKVHMEDDKKRRKAMKVAVQLSGVSSATIEVDKIVVIGDGVDAATLTRELRKAMGFADIVSVAPVEEKKDEKDEKKPETVICCGPHPWGYMSPQCYYEYQDPRCTIM